MMEVSLKVNYKDKVYQTNVIVDKNMTFENIQLLAKNQVEKQWAV